MPEPNELGGRKAKRKEEEAEEHSSDEESMSEAENINNDYAKETTGETSEPDESVIERNFRVLQGASITGTEKPHDNEEEDEETELSWDLSVVRERVNLVDNEKAWILTPCSSPMTEEQVRASRGSRRKKVTVLHMKAGTKQEHAEDALCTVQAFARAVLLGGSNPGKALQLVFHNFKQVLSATEVATGSLQMKHGDGVKPKAKHPVKPGDKPKRPSDQDTPQSWKPAKRGRDKRRKQSKMHDLQATAINLEAELTSLRIPVQTPCDPGDTSVVSNTTSEDESEDEEFNASQLEALLKQILHNQGEQKKRDMELRKTFVAFQVGVSSAFTGMKKNLATMSKSIFGGLQTVSEEMNDRLKKTEEHINLQLATVDTLAHRFSSIIEGDFEGRGTLSQKVRELLDEKAAEMSVEVHHRRKKQMHEAFGIREGSAIPTAPAGVFPVQDMATLVTVMNSQDLIRCFVASVDLSGKDPRASANAVVSAFLGSYTELTHTTYFTT